MEGFKPDIALEVHDIPAMSIAYDLLEFEGLSIGSSSAINVAGAMEVAKRLGPGHTIVTVLCDSGTRYGQSSDRSDRLIRVMTKRHSLTYL